MSNLSNNHALNYRTKGYGTGHSPQKPCESTKRSSTLANDKNSRKAFRINFVQQGRTTAVFDNSRLQVDV